MKTIQELLGPLTIEEQAIDLKYQIKLSELMGWTGDSHRDDNYVGQHYVQITGEDWSQAYLYALARTIQNIRDGIGDYFCGGKEFAIEGTITGMLGEIKASQILGVDFDRKIHLNKTKRYDLLVNGKTIDVKVNLKRGNTRQEVIVSEFKKKDDSEYYMFGRILSNTIFNLFGWCPSEKIIDIKFKKEGRTGYYLPKEKLHKFNIKEI